MQVQELQQFAWTPELGGRFTDFKLKLSPFLNVERRKIFNKGMTLKITPGQIDGTVIENKDFNADFDDQILSHVLDWANLEYAKTGEPIPCTPENKKIYLGNMANELTGHKTARPLQELEKEPEAYLNLFDYISKFTESMENFEKNLPGIACTGSNGSSAGHGNATNSPK